MVTRFFQRFVSLFYFLKKIEFTCKYICSYTRSMLTILQVFILEMYLHLYLHFLANIRLFILENYYNYLGFLLSKDLILLINSISKSVIVVPIIFVYYLGITF